MVPSVKPFPGSTLLCYIYYINPEDMFFSNIGPVKRIIYPGTSIYPGNSDPGYYWELISTNVQ